MRQRPPAIRSTSSPETMRWCSSMSMLRARSAAASSARPAHLAGQQRRDAHRAGALDHLRAPAGSNAARRRRSRARSAAPPRRAGRGTWRRSPGSRARCRRRANPRASAVPRPPPVCPASRLAAIAAPRAIETPITRTSGLAPSPRRRSRRSARRRTAAPARSRRSGTASSISSPSVPCPATIARIVEGRHHRSALLGDQPVDLRLRVVLAAADDPHFGAERLDRPHLVRGHQPRHADHRPHARRFAA